MTDILKKLQDLEEAVSDLFDFDGQRGGPTSFEAQERLFEPVFNARVAIYNVMHASVYPPPEHGWTCFHCGETFSYESAARKHFGTNVRGMPRCKELRAQIDRLRVAFKMIMDQTLCPEAFPGLWPRLSLPEQLHVTAVLIAKAAYETGMLVPGEQYIVGDGASAIAEERERQVSVEGWTAEHDDRHTEMELAAAAACYAFPIHQSAQSPFPIGWPCAWTEWYKPTDRRRDLVKAGALIAAEIDRLDRAAARGKSE